MAVVAGVYVALCLSLYIPYSLFGLRAQLDKPVGTGAPDSFSRWRRTILPVLYLAMAVLPTLVLQMQRQLASYTVDKTELEKNYE